MKKDKLVTLIKKYHLNNTVDSVKWSIKDKTVNINFISPDKTLVGSIAEQDVDIEDVELGIYTTGQLNKLLSVFSDDIDMSLWKIDGEAKTLNMSDKDAEVKYMLSDLSVIPPSGKPKKLPDFEFSMDITPEFVAKFIKSNNALPDISHVTINCDGKNKNEMIIGYSSNNTTRITFPIVGKATGKVDHKSFNANFLKEVLTANSDSKGTLEVSDAGLMRISYTGTNYTGQYFLVEVQHI